ncbi:MAG: glutathione S-transferase family protein [Candidatus Binataceae bacterium]
MKIYDCTWAPNPRRLRMFLAEKSISIPYEQVELARKENRAPEFLAINPAGTVPVLQLDDGSYLAETDAIARYLETLHPEPNLMGRDARELATIEMWERRMELNLFWAVARAFYHMNPAAAGHVKRIKEYGESQVAALQEQLAWLDRQLAGKEFIAGPRFTFADITAFVAIEFGQSVAGITIDPVHNELIRWHRAVASRPSTKA